MTDIPHNKPCIGKEEIHAATKVLQRSWLVMGKETEALEKEIRLMTGRRFAVAVNSGLSALHLSLIALGVGSGDEVILPTYTCTALLHAVNYVGAIPVIVDTEPDGFSLDVNHVRARRTKRTRAIIAPHTFGALADIDALCSLDIPVIEDCAQALGSSMHGLPVGRTGVISIFSFYASKMIAAGQGGMVVTDDESVFDTVSDLIHHDQRPEYRVRYNYQFTDLAAAVARAQLTKLGSFLALRREIAQRYKDTLQPNKAIRLYQDRDGAVSNNYRFIVGFPDSRARDSAIDALEKHGIVSIVPIGGFQLLHRLLKLDAHDFPRSERLAATLLSVPVFPCLTDTQVKHICKALSGLPGRGS